MTDADARASTLIEITEAVSLERAGLHRGPFLVEAFVERRYGSFLGPQEATCPQCERIPAGAPLLSPAGRRARARWRRCWSR